ncbi:MAG: prolipoprotein diacylglyceryl transferase [Flavobacteriales bacterium]|jgi:phosphatidylglycerol---prolipoprotein diacylglyceryl transferase|nr:prolipoprotein diacylglyceryl transferase [Flavobacteriales bacterium]
MLEYIDWRVNPLAFGIGPVSYRWYGLLFMTALVMMYWLVQRIYIREGIDDKPLFNASILIAVGAIAGARLGEVFFYNWEYFREHLEEIPKIWMGGLASHGAGIGTVVFSWLAARYVLNAPYLWVLDRLAVAFSAGLGMIRLGNLMNHEIVGAPTELPWAFVFHRGVDLLPRHPAQLYEAIFFVFIFLILGYMYLKTEAKTKPGLLTGWFFVLVPSMRFGVEFIKNSQGGLESNFGEILSTGQLLSIPFILVGALLILRSSKLTNKSPAKKIGSTTD